MNSTQSPEAIARWLTENVARLAELPVADIDAATPVVDFGVESLQLLGLAGDLAAWLERDISPTLLWEYPTIAELAAHLAATPATARRALVPLQTQGGAPPFYLVHELSGTLFSYGPVIKSMGKERMIYGFEAPFGRDEAAPFESVEELAMLYLGELRAHQPDGPYFLGGYSMGGLIAFEMARQLSFQGQTIGLLVLLDTLFPGLTLRAPGKLAWLNEHYSLFLDVPREQRPAYLQRRFQRVSARLRGAPLPPHDINPTENDPLLTPLSLHLREVTIRYRPGVFDGSLVYLKAKNNGWAASDDVGAWRRVVSGRVHTRPIPGRHGDITKGPNAAPLAAQLNRSLRRAQS